MIDDNSIFDPDPTPELRRRVDELEQTLDAVWENRCEDCSRPFHPRATRCPGCQLDALRSGT